MIWWYLHNSPDISTFLEIRSKLTWYLHISQVQLHSWLHTVLVTSLTNYLLQLRAKSLTAWTAMTAACSSDWVNSELNCRSRLLLERSRNVCRSSNTNNLQSSHSNQAFYTICSQVTAIKLSTQSAVKSQHALHTPRCWDSRSWSEISKFNIIHTFVKVLNIRNEIQHYIDTPVN